MGFGYGYSSRSSHGDIARDKDGNRVKSRFDSGMTLHVWAQQTQDFGQSSNGNIYFRGRTSYSYGSHFALGTIMPGNIALLNSDRYSSTTSGHQSSASGAVNHMTQYYIPALQDIAPLLETIADGDKASAETKARFRQRMRNYLSKHASELNRKAHKPGESRWSREADESGPTAGEYLGALVGLKPASVAKIARERAASDAKEAAANIKRGADSLWREAVTVADTGAREWAAHVAAQVNSGKSYVERLAKRIHRARGEALKRKASKKRLDSIRARLAGVREILADWNRREARAHETRSIRQAISTLERYGFRNPDGDDARAPTRSHEWREVNRAAGTMIAKRRAGLAHAQPALLALVNHAHEMEGAAAERENAERFAQEQERREKWLAGESAGYFGSRLTDERGGALMRVMGDTLETSWGAKVPLAHAVKVFRFVKLCREAGQAWHRNGRTIRVGHFQVDSIAPDGSFVAGCHSFNWPEVERVAALAGVAHETASAEALQPSASAA